MLDPLTALGAVANIAQFIEFAIKISSKSRDTYHSTSGNPIELEDLRNVNDDLSKISRKLRDSLASATTSTCLTEDEQALHELCKGCIDVSEELTAALSKIQHHGKRGKFRSFRQALKSVWSKDDIDQLERRMKLYKDELNFRIIVGLRSTIDFHAVRQTEGFAFLAEEAKNTIQSLICVTTEVHDGFERQEAVIADLHVHTEAVIVSHDENRREEHLELTSQIRSLAQQSSSESQHHLDAQAIAKMAVDLSLERNLAEHERTRDEMKRLKEEAEKQVEVLTEEIRQLKIELEAGVKTIVASIGTASTREAERLKETSNAKFNLWVAKELILEKLKAFIALFRFNFTTEAWMPKATTTTTWKLVPYPKFMGTAADVTNATDITEHTVAYRHVEICYPIAARNVPMVKMCLDQGVDVNGRLPDCDYVLMKAIIATYPNSPCSISEALAMRRDGRKIVQLLIEHGADPTKVPRVIEEEAGRDWMIQQLLKDVPDSNLRAFLTPTDAVWMGDVEQVKNTLSEMPELCELLARHKSSPLGIAVYQDDEEMVRLLLESGISPDVLDPVGSTPLAIAVSRHREPMVRILRTYGASITIQDPSLRLNPLEYALRVKSRDLDMALLDCQSTLSRSMMGGSYEKAFALAIEQGQDDTVAILLDWGADVFMNIRPYVKSTSWVPNSYLSPSEYLRGKKLGTMPGSDPWRKVQNLLAVLRRYENRSGRMPWEELL